MPAVVRDRRGGAQARDDRALLHDDTADAAAAVPEPRVTEVEGKAKGGDVQPDTGGLGRLRDGVGGGDREVFPGTESASLPADDCEGLGS